MPLQPLHNKVSRIVGLDLSSETIAYSLFVDGELERVGEVVMTGDVNKRLVQARKYSLGLGELLKPDLVAYESAVYIQNKQTVITLANFFGAVVSCMSDEDTQVRKFIPIEWQNFIGNPKLTAAEKNQIKTDFPGKSANWYKTQEREFRKRRTLDWANEKFGVHVASDNVSDAIGVGYTAVHKD